MSKRVFSPKRVVDMDRRVAHIETEFTNWTQRLITEVIASRGTFGNYSAGSSGSDQIPESDVLFDPDAGHTHDGSDSHTVALAGDVTGTNIASVVAQIEGKPIAAPAGADDKKAIYYNNGGGNFAYSFFTRWTMLGAWGTADCSTLGAADAAQPNSFTITAAALVSPMPVAGVITGLVIRLTGDVGGAGQDVIATVYKNGVATAVTATITGGAGTENEAVFSGGAVVFAAGDDLEVQAKANGVPAVVQAVYTLWGFFTP